MVIEIGKYYANDSNDLDNKETKDVSNGWQWVVEHKEEYCTKQ